MKVDLKEKLGILADAAKYDASCASSGSKTKRSDAHIGTTEGLGICHSYTPDGRCVSLLKILLTNYCILDCKYCINRVSSDTKRARFTNDEVVWLTMEFYKRNYIEGLFLSSGIIQSSDYTMEQLVAVAKSLRETHHFGGYIHLKTIPGADQRLIDEAGRWADRLSVNIELPTDQDLVQLAPEKKGTEIRSTMTEIKDRIDDNKSEKSKGYKVKPYAPAGQSTQMIIGATSTTDTQILKTSSQLYDDKKLRRVYYSAYSPIPDPTAVLPHESPALMREHRLYQADWLLRFYEFDVDEIATGSDRNLDLQIDPKLAWALANQAIFPIDVNKADRHLLLRIPGIGAKTVHKILQLRRHQRVRSSDLKKLGVAWNRARYFVQTADSNLALNHLQTTNFRERFMLQPLQMRLFE
jgi:putative DNA modification/repair radical SAM protein